MLKSYSLILGGTLVLGLVAVFLYTRDTSREIAVIVPRDYAGQSPVTLVVWLHGWSGSPFDKEVQFQRIADKYGIAFVGVNGPVTTPAARYGWTDSFLANYRRVHDALVEARTHMQVRSGGAIALGFSQGATVGIEAAVRQPEVFAGAITVSAGTSGPFPLEGIANKTALPRQRFVIVCGAKEDPQSVKRSNALANWLRDAGAAVWQPDYPEHAIHTFPLDSAERLPDWIEFVEAVGKMP